MNKVQFSNDTFTTPEDYNPFSIMAFLAFMFSLLCIVLAVCNPKLLSLPVFSALLGAFVLYRLHATNMARGHYLAGFALLASIFVFVMTASYQSMRYKHLEATAIKHCETWLNLVKTNQVYESHEMTLDFEKRHSEGTDLARLYGPVDQPDEDLQKYLDLEPEKTIRTIGENAKIKVGRIAYARPYSVFDRFEIHHHLDRSAAEEEEFHFTIVLLRTKPIKEKIYWEIEGLVNVSPPIPRGKRHIGAAGGPDREATY